MIELKTTVHKPRTHVWLLWTKPEHIVQWAHASDDWEARRAENELRVDGRFVTEMAAKDGSESFEFGGVYTFVAPEEQLAYTLEDGRKVDVYFTEKDDTTEITQRFDPEQQNSEEVQQHGWQSILDNFKKYAETNP